MLTKKNNIIQKLLANPIVLFIIGLAIIILISIPLAKNVSQRYRANQEIAKLQQEIKAQEDKKLLGEETIKYMQSDQYIEDTARLNLGYKKPGEQMVVIQQQETAASKKNINAGVNNADTNNQESNFTKWMRYFFKNNL